MKASRDKKVQVLKETVNRNKLKDNGENIDKMVSVLKSEGIEARYCPKA